MVVVCAWCGTTLAGPGARCPACLVAGESAPAREPAEIAFRDDGPVCLRHGAILTAAALGGINAPNLHRAALALREEPS